MDLLMAHQAAKQGYAHLSEDAAERKIAADLFERMLGKGRRRGARAVLNRQARRLRSLADVAGQTASHYVGQQTIPLAQILGSENRTHDFDIEFLPIREHIEQRWVGIAAAMQRGLRLPPVELVCVRSVCGNPGNDIYFVRDGHHRISVARALGQIDIEAIVTEVIVTEVTAINKVAQCA